MHMESAGRKKTEEEGKSYLSILKNCGIIFRVTIRVEAAKQPKPWVREKGYENPERAAQVFRPYDLCRPFRAGSMYNISQGLRPGLCCAVPSALVLGLTRMPGRGERKTCFRPCRGSFAPLQIQGLAKSARPWLRSVAASRLDPIRYKFLIWTRVIIFRPSGPRNVFSVTKLLRRYLARSLGISSRAWWSSSRSSGLLK